MHVVTGVARNRDSSPFDRMLVLAVAAPCSDLLPPVLLDYLYQIADFHGEAPIGVPAMIGLIVATGLAVTSENNSQHEREGT